MLTNFLMVVLQSWCEKYLDQWERWKFNTTNGPVYVTVMRESDGYNYDEIKI